MVILGVRSNLNFKFLLRKRSLKEGFLRESSEWRYGDTVDVYWMELQLCSMGIYIFTVLRKLTNTIIKEMSDIFSLY